MKKLFTLILTFTLIGFGHISEAQTTKKSKTKNENAVQSENLGVNDGIILENGQLLLRRDGRSAPVQKDFTLEDGTKIMRDGTVIMQNGERRKLQEGEMMMWNGELRRGGMAPEGTTQDERKEYYIHKGSSEMPLFSEQVEQRLNLMNQKIFLMSEKLRLMNEKMSKMSGNTSNSNLDQQIQQLDSKLRQLDQQMQQR